MPRHTPTGISSGFPACGPGGGAGRKAAGNVVEFRHEVVRADAGILRAHLHAGDFSRWTRDVLADDEFGRHLRGVERWYRNDTDGSLEPARQAILAAIDERYGPDAKYGERTVRHGP